MIKKDKKKEVESQKITLKILKIIMNNKNPRKKKKKKTMIIIDNYHFLWPEKENKNKKTKKTRTILRVYLQIITNNLK